MAELELKVGNTYRAKKPAQNGMYVNDRIIRWIGAYELQYDGPAVANGRHYPQVTKEVFLKWAARDVSTELPSGEWAQWNWEDRSKNK